MTAFTLMFAASTSAGPLVMDNALADTVVKVGVAGPFASGLAQSGKRDERGVQLAINELNSEKLTIARAMQQANSTDPLKFAPQLKMLTFESMLGPVKFDQTAEWISPPVTVYKLTGAELVPINP